MNHAAWGAKKDIRSRIRTIKRSPYNAIMKPVRYQTWPNPLATQKGGQGAQTTRRVGTPRQGKLRTPTVPKTPPPTASISPVTPPAATKYVVLATPTGFKKVREEQATPSRSKTPPTSKQEPLLWKIGEDYGM